MIFSALLPKHFLFTKQKKKKGKTQQQNTKQKRLSSFKIFARQTTAIIPIMYAINYAITTHSRYLPTHAHTYKKERG